MKAECKFGPLDGLQVNSTLLALPVVWVSPKGKCWRRYRPGTYPYHPDGKGVLGWIGDTHRVCGECGALSTKKRRSAKCNLCGARLQKLSEMR